MSITHYNRLRRLGLSRRIAWDCSKTKTALRVIETIKTVLFWSVLISCVMYLTSEHANAQFDGQRDYMHQLEHVAAQCLNEKGGAVKVGDEWFMCSIYPLGRMK